MGSEEYSFYQNFIIKMIDMNLKDLMVFLNV